ncbi:MAG: DNA ligase D [Armatimonadetes bacterium]|nr:DNA ligase D [Armatimonadota bacterium]
MSLDEYRSKRAFDQTPEPAPRQPAHPVGGMRFCIQRHRARRLHYDLRLEHSGLLKSWALPRGPSLNPADKRMAVETEDHPLEYLRFEGIIPQGHYGAGSMLVWDLGRFEILDDGDFASQHRLGDLKLRFYGRKVRGDFALVRTRSRELSGRPSWLLIKKKDAHSRADWDPETLDWSVLTGRSQEQLEAGVSGRPPCAGAVAAPMPDFIHPMLAQPGEAFSHPDWLFEMKWDGFRALAFGEEDRLRLISRRGNSLLRQFPELGNLPAQVAAASFVIDGEIVVLDERGVPDLQRLQPRMHAGTAGTVLRLARESPAVFYVFDLLYLNGFDVRGLALEERRRLLADVLLPDGVVRLSEAVDTEGEALFSLVKERQLEGVVAKHRRSPYRSGRCPHWIKIKTVQTQDCVVAGFTISPNPARSYFASLVLGLYQDGELVYVGNVGSGFSQKLLAEVYRELEPLVIPACPFKTVPALTDPARWLRPELVCEVKFGSITREGILRYAVFQRIRRDKAALECCRDQDEPAPPPEERAAVGGGQEQLLTIQGRNLKLTNLDKVLFPQDGYTKGDLIRYYDQVAELILPHLADRPLSLRRYPNGIDRKFFFQKRVKSGFPAWVPTYPLENSEGEIVDTILCSDRATLLYLANLGCIDQNPWLSRVGSLEQPDFMLLDLDPEGCSFSRVVEAALALRQLLDEIGLKSYPKTSGSRGIHIYVPVAPGYSYEQTRTLCQILARAAGSRHPGLFTLPRAPGRRGEDKVYIDCPQNREGATIASPYSVRAAAGAPVSTPLHWGELEEGVDFRSFTLRTAPRRFLKVGDMMAEALIDRQRLEEPVARLEELLAQDSLKTS